MKCGTGLGGCGVRVLSGWRQRRASCSQHTNQRPTCRCVCVLHFAALHASAQRMEWCSRAIGWLAARGLSGTEPLLGLKRAVDIELRVTVASPIPHCSVSSDE